MRTIAAVWNWTSSAAGRVVLGFILTTLLGGVLTHVYQRLSWKRRAMLGMYRERYKEGTAFLERLSSLIDRRYFALQRLIWSVQAQAADEKLAEREAEYFNTVREWNNSLRAIHNRIRLLIGEEQALEFLDYADDYRPENPQSLHYRFVLAHRAVMQARHDQTATEAALQEVDRLNWKLSSFLYDVTSLFSERAASLALLQMPRGHSVAAKQRQTSGPHRLPPDGSQPSAGAKPAEEASSAEAPKRAEGTKGDATKPSAEVNPPGVGASAPQIPAGRG